MDVGNERDSQGVEEKIPYVYGCMASRDFRRLAWRGYHFVSVIKLHNSHLLYPNSVSLLQCMLTKCLRRGLDSVTIGAFYPIRSLCICLLLFSLLMTSSELKGQYLSGTFESSKV